MYKIMIELEKTELRVKPGNDIWIPIKISGWNFEYEDFEFQLEESLREQFHQGKTEPCAVEISRKQRVS